MQRVKMNKSLFFTVNNVILKMYAIAKWNTKEIIVFKKVGIEVIFKIWKSSPFNWWQTWPYITCSDETFDSK